MVILTAYNQTNQLIKRIVKVSKAASAPLAVAWYKATEVQVEVVTSNFHLSQTKWLWEA